MNLVDKVKRRLFRPSETLDGYEHPELVDVIFRKTLSFNPRDDWPEMRGVATVLDFGGGAGRHYKQANSETVRWAVVETAAMVDRAKVLATDRLQFFTDVSSAVGWLGSVEVMHSDGAVQYTPDPLETVRILCNIGAKKMVWHRVLFSDDPHAEMQSSYLGDNGPGSLSVTEKIVRYKRTAINRAAFLAAREAYSLDDSGEDWFRFKAPL